MGTSKRYVEHFDNLMRTRLDEQHIGPCTLPLQAYGPDPIRWVHERPAVWVWLTWPHKPAERTAAFAAGWNDRVVIVEWSTLNGERNTVVWRNAVTNRST